MKQLAMVRLVGGLFCAAALVWVAGEGTAQAPTLPGQVKSRLEKATPAATEKSAEKEAGASSEAASGRGVVQRRDPFRSLLMRPGDEAGGQPLPPGKRGLVIAQLSVNGVVVTPTEKIAVVTMAGRNRAYFLRERDELFDGAVAKIGDDSVIFREKARDAFGRQYEREVVKQVIAGTTRSGARR